MHACHHRGILSGHNGLLLPACCMWCPQDIAAITEGSSRLTRMCCCCSPGCRCVAQDAESRPKVGLGGSVLWINSYDVSYLFIPSGGPTVDVPWSVIPSASVHTFCPCKHLLLCSYLVVDLLLMCPNLSFHAVDAPAHTLRWINC
jgi:hypothetical protein